MQQAMKQAMKGMGGQPGQPGQPGQAPNPFAGMGGMPGGMPGAFPGGMPGQMGQGWPPAVDTTAQPAGGNPAWMLCCAVLCCAVLYCAVPMLCRTTLCCTMLCRAVLRQAHFMFKWHTGKDAFCKLCCRQDLPQVAIKPRSDCLCHPVHAAAAQQIDAGLFHQQQQP